LRFPDAKTLGALYRADHHTAYLSGSRCVDDAVTRY